jgi:hypothetical protein
VGRPSPVSSSSVPSWKAFWLKAKMLEVSVAAGSVVTALSALLKEPRRAVAPPMVKSDGHAAGTTICQSTRPGTPLGRD